MPTAKQERGIIRRLKRQLAKHPRSRKLRKALTRHRYILRSLTSLRLKAWNEMDRLISLRVTEQGGNNVGVLVERIIKLAGGVPGEAWCGDTVAYCYIRAGSKSVVRAWAAVRWLEQLLTRVYVPRRGHVVIYIFDHTGLFKRWLNRAERAKYGVPRGSFWAGEGNTGNTGAASDSITGGDGVKLKIRHRSQVSSFRRVLR